MGLQVEKSAVTVLINQVLGQVGHAELACLSCFEPTRVRMLIVELGMGEERQEESEGAAVEHSGHLIACVWDMSGDWACRLESQTRPVSRVQPFFGNTATPETCQCSSSRPLIFATFAISITRAASRGPSHQPPTTIPPQVVR
jgi:hypothetical protein